MLPQPFHNGIVVPACSRLVPDHDSAEARVMLMAIAGQESAWSVRVQTPVGFARSYWQCEKNGAVMAVLTNDLTRDRIVNFARSIDIPPGIDTIYEAIAWNDPLACMLARLNLLLDPPPLPALGDKQAAWECYERVWRPGTPRPDTWDDRYAMAIVCAATPVATASVVADVISGAVTGARILS